MMEKINCSGLENNPESLDKKEEAREEWKKLITQGWRRTEDVWTKNSD